MAFPINEPVCLVRKDPETRTGPDPQTVFAKSNSFPTIIIEALQGIRGPDQQALADQGVAWITLLLQKNHDYGSTVFSSPCLAPKLSAASAILTRMSDKIDRLKTLAKHDMATEVKESFDDTVRDLGAYCLLYLCQRQRDLDQIKF